MKYKYELIRSERKSISLIISDDNKITVRCPWTMRMDEIQLFLDMKKDWIERVTRKNSVRLARNDDVIEYRQIYVAGKTVPLEIGKENNIYTDKVCVKDLSDIEKLFIDHYKESFLTRVKEFAELTRLTPREVSVRSYKGRWGCCDSANRLTFNFVLFMLPQRLQDYVIIHELCHTLCHNHSSAFWKLVSDYIPDYRAIRAEMKEFSFLVGLYSKV